MGSKIALLKSTPNAENFRAVCLGLSSVISAHFTIEMRVAERNRKKFPKLVIFGVKGRSK